MLLASASARAQESVSSGAPPAETGLAVQQVVLGAVSGLFAGAGATVIGMSPHPGSGGAIGALLVSTAALPGLAVCTLGRSSRWYDGSCAGPIVGAFLGTLLVGIPMGHAVVANGRDDISGSLLLSSFVLTAVGAGVGATLGWHLGKHRRQPANASRPVANLDPPPPAWPEMPVQRLAAVPGTFTTSVLAFSF